MSLPRRGLLQALAAVLPAASRKKKPVGNSWSNTTTSLIVLIEESGTYSGIFGYSPVPGPGNLVFSVAASPGEDPYGNTYLMGISSYVPGANTININAGAITGGLDQTCELILQDGLWALQSGQHLTDTVQAVLAGNSSPSGTNATVTAYASTGFLDEYISGAIIKAPNGSVDPYPWQTPSYNTGWAAGSTASTDYQALMYRYTAEDEVWLYGSAHCTTGSPSNTVLTLPADYAPKPTGGVGVATIFPAGAIVSTTSADALNAVGRLNVQSSGTVVIGALTMASSDNLYFNHKIPLGNIL